jgi:ornithine cyclodeaminase
VILQVIFCQKLLLEAGYAQARAIWFGARAMYAMIETIGAQNEASGMSKSIPVFSAQETAERLPYSALIEALKHVFINGAHAPQRSVHSIVSPAGDAPPIGDLMMMPAWQPGGTLAVKLATVYPGNARHGLPQIQGLILVFDATTGKPLAVMDGAECTRRRTAAASALASQVMSRRDSRTLSMIGTGALAPHLLQAHLAVRPAIQQVRLWGRRPDKARALAKTLAAQLTGIEITHAPSAQVACEEADIVCCATNAKAPIVEGAWIKPGTHIDLVGSYSPAAREIDTAGVLAARVIVDTWEGFEHEAGDLLIPLQEGAITKDHILGDLASILKGQITPRRTKTDITLFKSVGTAIEDLAAAQLVLGG